MVAQEGQRVTALLYCHHHSSSYSAQDVLVTLPKNHLYLTRPLMHYPDVMRSASCLMFLYTYYSLCLILNLACRSSTFFFHCHSQTNGEVAYTTASSARKESLCIMSHIIICIFAGWTKGISHQRGVSIKKWYLKTKGYQDDIMLLRRVWLTHWGLWPSEVKSETERQ